MSSVFDVKVQLSANGPIGLPEQHCERVPTFPMAPRRLRTGRNLNASFLSKRLLLGWGTLSST